MALAGGEVSSLDDKEGAKLQDALTAVCTALAKSIAWDGEGAGVMVEVIARNGRTGSEARAAARAVAESHLVKAAVHGRDANWGRVVAAAGNAGVAMDQAAIGTKMAGYTLLEKGNVTATAERESAVARAIRSAFVDRNTVTIEVDLAAGKSSGMAWTCDLSAEYVSINADYRS
jgi:glutamate N-acetyltransferase/amino-acid N-acetyltransferase